jgi:hypothetical protein
MRLIVHELTTNSGDGALKQLLTVGGSDVVLAAVRPHLLKYGVPAGSLYMEVRTAANVLISASAAVTIASITAVTNTYAHGYLRFDLPVTLLKNTSYYFALQSTGYAYSDTDYIGWCNDYDLFKYDFISSNALDRPLDIEMWEHKLVTRGSYP